MSSTKPSTETVIQAGLDGMAITSVPVRVNEDLRPSRLVTSIPNYIRRHALTMFRIFVAYKAFAFFFVSGALRANHFVILRGLMLWAPYHVTFPAAKYLRL